MNYSLTEALKYQQRERLSVAQIHPSLRFTRLGAVLREYATAPDEVGALAHSALTGDHSQPLELMPLHLLKDRMQEEPDHPLAKEFNWERVPEGVQLDDWLRRQHPPTEEQSIGRLWNLNGPTMHEVRQHMLREANEQLGLNLSPKELESAINRSHRQVYHTVYHNQPDNTESQERIYENLADSPASFDRYY